MLKIFLISHFLREIIVGKMDHSDQFWKYISMILKVLKGLWDKKLILAKLFIMKFYVDWAIEINSSSIYVKSRGFCDHLSVNVFSPLDSHLNSKHFSERKAPLTLIFRIKNKWVTSSWFLRLLRPGSLRLHNIEKNNSDSISFYLKDYLILYAQS